MNSIDWENLRMFNSALIIFGVVALVIFFVFRLVKFLLPAFFEKERTQKLAISYLPIVELFAWLFFCGFSIQLFLQRNILYAFGFFLILTIILLFLSWFALKDFIAGIIFRTSRKYNIGDKISFQDITGRIHVFRYRNIEIESNTGQIVAIPYNKLLSSIISKPYREENINNQCFTLRVKAKKTVTEITHDLQNIIMNLPWVSVKKTPHIDIANEDNNYYTFQITVYVLDPNHVYRIKDHLINHFQE